MKDDQTNDKITDEGSISEPPILKRPTKFVVNSNWICSNQLDGDGAVQCHGNNGYHGAFDLEDDTQCTVK